MIAPASLKADATKITWVKLSETVQQVQSEAFWLIPSSMLVVGLCAVIQKAIGAPWVWDHVHFLLDRIQEVAFPADEVEGELHHHRVTLFKYSQWCLVFKFWPWSGWLHAVERSGHSTRRKSICFKAPDDADNAEGVVGNAWARKSVVCVEALPDLSEQTLTDKKLASYAKATKVARDSMTPPFPRSRSFYAIPVESKNRIWGVIVIDSRHPLIQRKEEIGACFSLIGKYLGKLLEKA